MQHIIREPVDSGSLSQWLVINKIIGERWQRFLEFFLICMPFCAEFFKTPFCMCEGCLSNDTLSCSVTRSCRRFKLAGVTCTCMLQRPDVWDPHSFAAVPICMSECPASVFLSCVLSREMRFKDFSVRLGMSFGVDSLRVFLQ